MEAYCKERNIVFLDCSNIEICNKDLKNIRDDMHLNENGADLFSAFLSDTFTKI